MVVKINIFGHKFGPKTHRHRRIHRLLTGTACLPCFG
jgi:hypothetical protein